MKVTTNGQTMVRFSLATDESWKDKDGKKQERTEWHNIVVWGKSAETAEKYLRKGKQVYIEGRIQSREYEAEGVKKTITDIRCDNFVMLDKMELDSPKPQAEKLPDTYDDDIPF